MRHLFEMSFYIMLHEKSEKRKGRTSRSRLAFALLLIRNVDFAEKLDSSSNEFMFLSSLFFSLSRSYLLCPSHREDSQSFKQIYEETKIAS